MTQGEMYPLGVQFEGVRALGTQANPPNAASAQPRLGGPVSVDSPGLTFGVCAAGSLLPSRALASGIPKTVGLHRRPWALWGNVATLEFFILFYFILFYFILFCSVLF